MSGRSLRHLKQRIHNIDNTRQITRAMEMVAASKLLKAESAALALRPYADRLKHIIARIIQGGAVEEGAELLNPSKADEGIGYLVIAGDRGLAGGYNQNVIRLAREHMQQNGGPVTVMAVSRKVRDHFRRRGDDLQAEWVGLGDEVPLALAREIADTAMEFFRGGIVSGVQMVYTSFISTGTQRPVVEQLFPIPAEQIQGEDKRNNIDYEYEPSAGRVLASLLPLYAHVQVYRALLEAKASEHAARRTAMHNATENAEEMIEEFTLTFNRARQAAITREISEIVGGANALEEGRL